MVRAGAVVATILINVPEGLSVIISESLAPEVECSTSERSSVVMSVEEGRIGFLIEASDVVALRAAINSYLRWVGAILDVVEAIG